ncbi:hypothetical protein [Delftia phage PhiW-14]|uniref:Uncharacterized protein n=1 Tax=Delftia phage PhiW-14 TaxID=665032 RepID=C9DGJ1_BPW14|nr:hypothetical protein DP-phiW-14_gp221 [Delftia phage PhiW-14]ACV50242.1 hypothetical protein [Delftia phage PhiW-14]
MLVRIILAIGFTIVGVLGIRNFRLCRGGRTTHELSSLLSVMVALLGVFLIWITPFNFSTQTPYGFGVIGFCWIVIISNLVNIHQVRVENDHDRVS